MPLYRIFRMKEGPRQQFRWAPHLSGATSVKPKDYEEAEPLEAPNVYAAWTALRQTQAPLRVGDLLACDPGELRVVKYVGFEEARWVLPEAKTGLEAQPA
ncbi:MAG: hypothetical protein HY822_05460 [Acidobacteria bacterium]|nr:hypothetical protein [Acidobacteriota bacterium]